VGVFLTFVLISAIFGSVLTFDTGFRRFPVQRFVPRQCRQDFGGVAGQPRGDGQAEAGGTPDRTGLAFNGQHTLGNLAGVGPVGKASFAVAARTRSMFENQPGGGPRAYKTNGFP